MNDAAYMALAVAAARRGRFTCMPNPPVGALIVRDKRIIAEGWHRRAGEAHAEIHALRSAGEKARGATLYVTLEPCSTYGRTPPCTEAVIAAGIARVVIGINDPNPAHAGRATEIFREAGIDVTELHDPRCARLCERFAHFITTGTPFLEAKWAITSDGKIATYTGASKWITNAQSRQRVQELRHEHAAVMVGIGTVLADDPALNIRLPDAARQPAKIIVDTSCRLPRDSRLLQSANVYLCCAEDAPEENQNYWQNKGVTVLPLPRNPHTPHGIDLKVMCEELGKNAISSALVEGGGMLLGGLFDAGCIQRVTVFMAAKVFGGATAPTPVAGIGCDTPESAWRLEEIEQRTFGDDIMLTGRVFRCKV